MSNELVNFEELLKRDGSFLYTFKGVSMKPLLHQGKDVVIISSIDRPIKKLDIVLYKVGERYVLHRVLKIKKDQVEKPSLMKLISHSFNCLSNIFFRLLLRKL